MGHAGQDLLQRHTVAITVVIRTLGDLSNVQYRQLRRCAIHGMPPYSLDRLLAWRIPVLARAESHPADLSHHNADTSPETQDTQWYFDHDPHPCLWLPRIEMLTATDLSCDNADSDKYQCAHTGEVLIYSPQSSLPPECQM